MGRVRFGRFEFDPKSLELRESGSLVRLRQQPAKVLSVLLANPGGIVTREELRAEVWGSDTLDRLRPGPELLREGDPGGARRQRRRPVLRRDAAPARVSLDRSTWSPFFPRARCATPRGRVVTVPGGASSRSLARSWESLHRVRPRHRSGGEAARPRASEPRWQRVTFRRGSIGSARFAPGGEVAYTAAWDGEPSRLYAAPPRGRRGARGHRRCGDPGGGHRSAARSLYIRGAAVERLPRSPLAGRRREGRCSTGCSQPTPRPDGARIAVTRAPGDGTGVRVEFPLGTVIGRVNQPGALRISPSGREVALVEHPLNGDDAGIVHLFGPGGEHRVLGERWASLEGLAWSADGKDVLVTAAREGADTSLYAISLGRPGRTRLVLSAGGRLVIRDVARGRADAPRTGRRSVRRSSSARRASRECELTWLDGTSPQDLATDGRLVLLAESGDGGGKGYCRLPPLAPIAHRRCDSAADGR